jgi:hypothetical protein
MAIYFFSTSEEPYRRFSNFSAYGFELDGCYWETSEHYYQAQKFVGTPLYKAVREAATPKEAAKLGRDTENRRKDWEAVKDEVMRRAVMRKFETHAELRALLLETGDEELIENAPNDYYWGCGKEGTGKNMMGKLLCEVRAKLRGQNPAT